MSWRLAWRQFVPRAVKAQAFIGLAFFGVMIVGMCVVMLILLSQMTKSWWSMAIATIVMAAALAPFFYIGLEGTSEGIARIRRKTNEQIRNADHEAERAAGRVEREKATRDVVSGRVSIAPEASAEGALSDAAQPGALSKTGDRKQTS